MKYSAVVPCDLRAAEKVEAMSSVLYVPWTELCSFLSLSQSSWIRIHASRSSRSLAIHPKRMWLLTTDRAELKWFPQPPQRYAILSHVWAKDASGLPTEQTFQEVQQINRECARTDDNPRNRVSLKIRQCCIFAEAHGFQLVWLDACCTNRESSAELSEALNSMFRWYADAEVCYAYLHDVSGSERPATPDSEFRTSEWFKRGWTLQELIAPKDVVFLSRLWFPIASKRSFAPLLEEITRVDADVLMGTMSVHEVSVARRMSWAARRETSRVEDEAYCLMGIFDVQLPIIYGQGRYTFVRLQEEILRRIPDATMLAWGPRGDLTEMMVGYRFVFPTAHATSFIENSCLFATRPAAFSDVSASFIPVPSREFARVCGLPQKRPHFRVTGHGIQALCPVVTFSSGCTLMLLPCCEKIDGSRPLLVALLLRQQSQSRPMCVGTRILLDAQADRDTAAGLLEAEYPENNSATLPTQEDSQFSYTSSYEPVRYVLVPVGFNFDTCMQRPLREGETAPKPAWKQCYIAYLPQHVMHLEAPPSVPTALSSTPASERPRRKRASYSHAFRLYTPDWCASVLREHGFSVPPDLLGSGLAIKAGDRLVFTFTNEGFGESMHMVVRADIAPYSPSGFPSLGALWCTMLLPGNWIDPRDALLSPIYREDDAQTTDLDDRIRPPDRHGANIQGEDGFVDLWEHSGRQGSKEFVENWWRLRLTFTPMGEYMQGASRFCRVYLVDVDLGFADVLN
ncbi:HET-domain-containing protein [Trametes sanguinea]|nr:HET-domain-containing protein [Trametes sanguinea]